MRINELLGFTVKTVCVTEIYLKILPAYMSEAYFRLSKKIMTNAPECPGKTEKTGSRLSLKVSFTRSLMPYAEPDSRLVKIMADQLKGGNTGVLLFTGKFIAAVKKSFPSLFSGLKLKK